MFGRSSQASREPIMPSLFSSSSYISPFDNNLESLGNIFGSELPSAVDGLHRLER